MTRRERDQIMYYSGVLKGICSMLTPTGESDDDTEFIVGRLMEISQDLEMIGNGTDH